MALTAWPKPAPSEYTARISAPAAILQRTHAESASESSASITIHTQEPTKRLHATHRFACIQPDPASAACTKNTSRPGIHVTIDNTHASTDNLPSTYSSRENGLQKYSGSALLDVSEEISPGPRNVVRRNANVLWTFRYHQ